MTDFHKEVKAGQNFCQSHYHVLLGVILVYLQLLSIRRLLTGLCYLDRHWWSAQAVLRQAGITAASWKTINHLNSLIVERTGFMLTEPTRMTILPVIDIWTLLPLSTKLNACVVHGNLTIITFRKQKSLLANWANFHHYLAKILMIK